MMAIVAATPADAGGASCPVGGDRAITLASFEPRLELRLGDERRLRLVGLDPAGATPNDPDLGDTGRAALAALLAGKALSAHILSDKVDRWGRLAAMVFSAGETTAGGVAAMAIARGLGRYRPEPDAHPCRDALLSAEADARRDGLGLWRDPYYGVLAVDDREAFAERAATIVVAQGRLRQVDTGPFRTKLRFAAPGEVRYGLLVAVVPSKVVKRYGEAGVRFEALIGRTLRIRGLLDLRFGPQIEIAGPDALEVLADVEARGAKP